MCEKLGGAVGKSTKDPGNDFFQIHGILGNDLHWLSVGKSLSVMLQNEIHKLLCRKGRHFKARPDFHEEE